MYRKNCDTIRAAPRRIFGAIAGLCAIIGLLIWSALPEQARAEQSGATTVTQPVRVAVEVCGASRFNFPDVRRVAKRSDCWPTSAFDSEAKLHNAGSTAGLEQRLRVNRSRIAQED